MPKFVRITVAAWAAILTTAAFVFIQYPPSDISEENIVWVVIALLMSTGYGFGGSFGALVTLSVRDWAMSTGLDSLSTRDGSPHLIEQQKHPIDKDGNA